MSRKQGIAVIMMAAISLCCSLGCLFLFLQLGNGQAQETETQYVMYVGTNDKDTYRAEHTNEEARDIVDGICLKYFDGYTLQEATGSWTDEKSNITHEYTLVCYFDGTTQQIVHAAADEIIEALNQNTVLIEQDEIKVEYYAGK